MKVVRFSKLLGALALCSALALAGIGAEEEAIIATTEDGRQVILYSDGTWEWYLSSQEPGANWKEPTLEQCRLVLQPQGISKLEPIYRLELIEQTMIIMRRRIDHYGLPFVEMQALDTDQVEVTTYLIQYREELRDLLGRTGRLAIHTVIEIGTSPASNLAPTSATQVTLRDLEGIPCVVVWEPVLTGEVLSSARTRVSGDPRNPACDIVLTLNELGATQLVKALQKCELNTHLAIVLDNLVCSLLIVNEALKWSSQQGWQAIRDCLTISGSFTPEACKHLEAVLCSGSLPASVMIMEDQIVQETAGPKDERKAALREALWALKDAMLQKVDYDVSVTAQAFTNVKDYWRVKRWADIFRVPLRILEDTISILTRLTDWRNIKHLFGTEAACQVLLTMAMIQDLRQVGNNLVCALDGPAYIESVKRMLAAADATTGLGDFSPTHYGWVVENWLNGLGEVPVLLLPEKVTRGVKQGFVAGALAVKLNIASQFDDLTRNVLNIDFPADFPFEEVTAQIKEIAREIVASSVDEQTVKYPVPSNVESQFGETKLGAVAGLYRAFGEVAGCVAEHVQLQQTVEVTKLLETGTNAVLLYTITHKIPGTEDVRVAQQVFTLAGVLTGSYVHTFVENPENRFYALPQEMLLMLPVELTNLWMVADGVVSYIEDSLRFVLNDAGVKQEKIAFISLRDGNREIYVMNADGSNHQRLTNNPAADLYHAWSPDGGKIAFTSDRDGNSEIYVMNADGSNQQRLTSNSAFDYRPKWSPDGTKILFESRSNDDMDYDICMINADGTNERNLTNRPTIFDGLPGWSPDGSGILFVSNKDGDTELLVMNPDGTNERNLTDNLYNDWYGVYSPDGRKIAYWDGRAGEYDLYIMDTDGRNKYPLLPEDLHWEMLLGWVPNTNTVVFALYRTTHYDVYTINLDGTGQRFLASVAVDDYSVSWSPSGKKVAFTSDRDGNYAIYVMDADGSNLQRLTNNPDGDANPVWSPILPE